MSTVTAVPIQPLKRGSLAKLLLGIALLVAAGLLLAWAGAGRMRGSDVGDGLIVRTIRPGHGPKVTMNDGVMVNYTGRLTDGTTFDSNSGREPVPMLPAQVIPGFGKALTEMQKGGKYRIRIPAKLAYGATPPRGAPIPPNAPRFRRRDRRPRPQRRPDGRPAGGAAGADATDAARRRRTARPRADPLTTPQAAPRPASGSVPRASP